MPSDIAMSSTDLPNDLTRIEASLQCRRRFGIKYAGGISLLYVCCIDWNHQLGRWDVQGPSLLRWLPAVASLLRSSRYSAAYRT
jgi:hypothetical protein